MFKIKDFTVMAIGVDICYYQTPCPPLTRLSACHENKATEVHGFSQFISSKTSGEARRYEWLALNSVGLDHYLGGCRYQKEKKYE